MVTIQQANPLAENNEIKNEIMMVMERVLSRGQYIHGPETTAFEDEFASYIGVSHAMGVASGTDAIRLALHALGVGNGDEVVTVAHTAVATVAAIEQCGAIPVLVDVEPSSFTMDPARLEEATSPRTKVIIPVHLYGHPASLDPILAIANRKNIYILEDCAQAHGAEYHGRRVGSFGQIAAFSFYPTKNLGAIGDGGMVVTGDSVLAEKVRSLREYGWKQRYVSSIPGFNSRLDELQAAILRVKLGLLSHNNSRRHALAAEYTRQLKEYVITPVEKDNCLHAYHLYVIRSLYRDSLRAFLEARGIGTAIHYPVPVHQQPAYLHLHGGSLSVTEKLAGEILSLPLYPQMSMEQVRLVANAIKEFFDARTK